MSVRENCNQLLPILSQLNVIIGHFQYIKIQLEREVQRTKTKESGLICLCLSHSLQLISIVFVLSASLSS